MKSGWRCGSRASASPARRRRTSAWNRGPLVVAVKLYPWLCFIACRISSRSTTRAPKRSAARAGTVARTKAAARATCRIAYRRRSAAGAAGRRAPPGLPGPGRGPVRGAARRRTPPSPRRHGPGSASTRPRLLWASAFVGRRRKRGSEVGLRLRKPSGGGQDVGPGVVRAVELRVCLQGRTEMRERFDRDGPPPRPAGRGCTTHRRAAADSAGPPGTGAAPPPRFPAAPAARRGCCRHRRSSGPASAPRGNGRWLRPRGPPRPAGCRWCCGRDAGRIVFRAVIVRDGFRGAPLRGQRVGQVVVGDDVVGRHPHRVLEQRDRVLPVARLGDRRRGACQQARAPRPTPSIARAAEGRAADPRRPTPPG